MDFEPRVKALYPLAIDAYMVGVSEYFGNHKLASQPPVSMTGSTDMPVSKSASGYVISDPQDDTRILVVKPPLVDGTGGGRILLCLNSYGLAEVPYDGDRSFFVNEFDRIRDSIEGQFRYLHELPAPSPFNSELDSVTSAVSALALDFSVMATWAPNPDDPDDNGSQKSTDASRAGTPGLPSHLYPQLKLIFDNLSDSGCFSGSAIVPLKLRYTSGLQVATRAIYGLLCIYGGHIAAEQELWVRANTALDSILAQAHNGFIGATSNSGEEVDWSAVLKIVGVACQGLSLGLTITGVGAPAAAAVRLLGLGVTALEEFTDTPKTPPQQTMRSFDEVMTFISSALSEFRAIIRAEEETIEKNIEANLTAIRSDEYSSFYDNTGFLLRLDGLNTDLGEDRITWSRSAAAEVFGAMDGAAPYYTTAGEKLGGTGIWEAATRPIGLGTSTTGPAQALDDFGAMLRALLLALGEELRLGSANVKDVQQMFIDYDDRVQRQLENIVSDIDLVSIAPWDPATTAVDPLSDPSGIAPLRKKSMGEIMQEGYDDARSKYN